MRKTLENLRNKEQHEKERFAFIGAFVVTAIIVLFWVAGFTTINTSNEAQLANTTSPWESLKNQFSGLTEEFKK